MTRWIVAGLLLLVLVGLIVMDEVGFTPADPVVQAGPDEAAAVAPGAEPLLGANDPEKEAIEALRNQAKADCDPLVPELDAVLGEAKREAIGDALYVTKQMTPEQVGELCRSLRGQPRDVIVARMLEVSGLQP